MPTGPRAWNLSVLMPISAPRPYSNPSANRVLAFTITLAESTSPQKALGVKDGPRDDGVGVVAAVAVDVAMASSTPAPPSPR